MHEAAVCRRCLAAVPERKRLFYVFERPPRCYFCGVEVAIKDAVAFLPPGTLDGERTIFDDIAESPLAMAVLTLLTRLRQRHH